MTLWSFHPPFEVDPMRSFRGLLLGLALLAVAPTVGSAQAGRLFEDSWFWGAKTGMLLFSTEAVENAYAPLFGGEWLITRTRGALYVAYEQAFFTENSAIEDLLNTNGERIVEMTDMRRVTFAALAFPKNLGGIRPYAGVGMAMNFIQEAVPLGSFQSASQQNDILATIEEQRTRGSVLLMGGVQLQYARLSIFGQATMMPSQSGFLFNGRSTYIVEGGVRWNVGSAIERIR
jgi:hypothetical protein